MFRLASKPVQKSQVRSLYTSILESDINITKAGKVNISVGRGGRSSRTGYTATVFGGTGGLGRLLVSKLARHGTVTVVPFRDQMKGRDVKPCGDLGVVNPVEFDIRNTASIEEAVAYSDIVYNLVGTEWEGTAFKMADVNIEASRRIAQASKDAGVSRFIQVSSYCADPESASTFYATKGLGEKVVREIIPDATIVRPGKMYGRFGSRFLQDMIWQRQTHFNRQRKFNVNQYEKLFFPTHYSDVAKALEIIGFDDTTAGELFELHANEKYSHWDVKELVYTVRPDIMFSESNYPVEWAKLMSKLLYGKWRNIPTMDEIERQLIAHNPDPKAKTFADLGVVPDKFTDKIHEYILPKKLPMTAVLGDSSHKDIKRGGVILV
ncbi:hypothetical protein BABINDRAFT_7977 [Babjeviella inositovora NRRL Y-12698]|uniref:NAD(P)-binding domain-containing protein n=1 Tax=Babjeviella inositovora NRRL Y-12698 TaxID=984486 RepID=A0A1E3QPZ8_9ASCO|nr:uncharacterized protein BABINDRAFT_7977 [Babjeviella inositovora NRRL Y-12698]ODQ79773.1 hypothetical protein BABINDRAFT_7977 [Babjeviella inositovora NRRL Y-12698]